jgi:anti-sigma B factor antagonist
MKFAIEKKDGVVVIELKASLEGGPDTFDLKDEVKARLGQGERKFLLNMTHAGFVNSTGIGVVVGIFSSIKQAEGKLRICGVSERARRAFVVTGVWGLFDVSEDPDEAVKILAES